MAQPMANAIPLPVPPGSGMGGQQIKLTPEQMEAFQQHLAREAQKQGMTPEQFGEKLKAQAMKQMQGQAQPGNGPQQIVRNQQVPIPEGPPKPDGVAVAKFLKSQNLKSRPVVHDERRRDMFKVKRALRALQSPAYATARAKNPLLPEVKDRASAEDAFKKVVISRLIIRVSRIDPSENPAHGQPGHVHGAPASKEKGKKKEKGAIWHVKSELQQDTVDSHHYVWLYEGPQWMRTVYAVGALIAVVAIVLFPLWPIVLRQGVWYLSMGALGLLGAFFALAIVRLILFLLSLVLAPPGIWLYPNLFEDVGFFDSFKPLWAWRETKESLAAKKTEKRAKKQARREKKAAKANGKGDTSTKSAQPASVSTSPNTNSASASTTTGAQVGEATSTAERRNLNARVEETEED